MNNQYQPIPDGDAENGQVDANQNFTPTEVLEATLSRMKFRTQRQITIIFVILIGLTTVFFSYPFYCFLQSFLQEKDHLKNAILINMASHGRFDRMMSYPNSINFIYITVEYTRDFYIFYKPVELCHFVQDTVACDSLTAVDKRGNWLAAAESYDSKALYFAINSMVANPAYLGIFVLQNEGKSLTQAKMYDTQNIEIPLNWQTSIFTLLLCSYSGSTAYAISGGRAFMGRRVANSSVYRSVDRGNFKQINSSEVEFTSGALSKDGTVLFLTTSGSRIWRWKNDVWEEADAVNAYWKGIACDQTGSKAIAIANGMDAFSKLSLSTLKQGVYLATDGMSFRLVHQVDNVESMTANEDLSVIVVSTVSEHHISIDYGYSWVVHKTTFVEFLILVNNFVVAADPRKQQIMRYPIPSPAHSSTEYCPEFGPNLIPVIVILFVEVVLFLVFREYYPHVMYEVNFKLFHYRIDRKEAFISHSWKDETGNSGPHERAREIRQNLENRGVSTWFDEYSLFHNIRRAIANGIKNSDCVVVCITREYVRKVNTENESEACYYELKRTETGKIIPLIMEENVEINGYLASKLDNILMVYFDFDFVAESQRFETQMTELANRIQATRAALIYINN